MSKTTITYIVVACCGVFGVAAFAAFILVPAWAAYEKLWERVAATFLSLYVLAGLLRVGTGLGGVVVLLWARVFCPPLSLGGSMEGSLPPLPARGPAEAPAEDLEPLEALCAAL